MAKRHLLLFLALVMLSFNAFSQTQPQGSGTQQDPYLISTADEFLWIREHLSSNYRQIEDIDLGIISVQEGQAIINSTFTGTYNGDGHTITYSAHLIGTIPEGDYGLFSTVTGKIQNLNLNADVTFSGTANDMQVGLLCGTLRGTVESCNVSGNINSTVQAGDGGGTSAGLVVGECAGGTIKYCNAIGNVTGVGYVGGIVGEMTSYTNVSEWVWDKKPTVLGCSFVGSVTANNPEDTSSVYEGSFAGGICGFANSGATINLCYVNADITSGKQTNGVASTNGAAGWVANGKPTVTNNYAEGTVNGQPIGAGNITNSTGNTSYNYYPGGSTQNGGTQMTTQQIVDALNTAAGNDKNIHFSNVSGDVVFGQQNTEKVCETPTNLQVQQVVVEGVEQSKATWNVGGESSLTESKWYWNLDGSENYTETTNLFVQGVVSPSPNPYTFYVKSYCSYKDGANTVEVYSDVASIEFFVDCPKPTGLTASSISYNSITVTYTAPAKSKLTVGSTEIVSENVGDITKTITGLTPETEYEVRVEVMCGSEYEESLSTNITTTAIPAPTGLAVSTAYDGTEEKGSANIAWDMVDGLTYEIEGQQGDKTSEYTIDNLAIGNYTLRLRAKVSGKTSAWVEMPYTISSPEAPYNPQVTYTQDGDTYDVTITWQKGATGDVQGWKVNGGNIQTTQTFTLENQTPGTSTNVSIVEYVNANTFSRALIVPIQVPCLPATLPTNISTTQTTATFTFASEKQGRKIVIGSNEYNASSASVTISNLNTATNYNYSVVEYCTQTLYSEKSGTFATVGCYQVSNLEISNVSTTTATVSWQSQSGLSGLQYQIVLKKGDEVVSTDVQTTTTKTFSGLTKATKYTVEVSEQCGNDNWTNSKIISFTTESGVYTTIDNGNFNSPKIWENGKVPTGGAGEIIINHMVTLSHKLTLSGSCRITNQGVLQITQQGELINTTNNNVGGIVEIVTPQKTINQWTFIGAPFKNNYPLGVIKPVSGSDISVSKYNYTAGRWSNSEDGANEWATINTTMEAGEGMFAWPFYSGVVTFTTYGDKGTVGAEYDFNKTPATALNNEDVITVTESLTTSSGGKWMALANPYPFKLNVATFLSDNNTLSTTNPNPDPNSNTTIQGEVIYKFDSISWTTHNSGEILMTEGFFVNFASEGSNTATFKKTQRLANQSKSAITPREFVKLALVDGKKEIDLLFAHNEKSENSYDIYDANKMFSPIEIAEPYFVTGGFDLVKEEVKELPYYATMNVRSYKDTVMSFVMKSIPEGLKVSIIDGENVINMYEGSVYTTEFLKGENEDRFKLYVRKADRLEEVRGRSVSITNCNRLVNVQSKEKDLTMDVFNAVGQIVYSTTEYNFNLASLPAGTYIVMAHNKRVNERVKIVIN